MWIRGGQCLGTQGLSGVKGVEVMGWEVLGMESQRPSPGKECGGAPGLALEVAGLLCWIKPSRRPVGTEIRVNPLASGPALHLRR